MFFNGLPSIAFNISFGQLILKLQLLDWKETVSMFLFLKKSIHSPLLPVTGHVAPPKQKIFISLFISVSPEGVLNFKLLFSVYPIHSCLKLIFTLLFFIAFSKIFKTSIGFIVFFGKILPLLPTKVSSPLAASQLIKSLFEKWEHLELKPCHNL